MATSTTPMSSSPPEKAPIELFSPTPSYHSKQEGQFPFAPEAAALPSSPAVSSPLASSPPPQFNMPQSPPPQFFSAQSPPPQFSPPLSPGAPAPLQLYAHPSMSSSTPSNHMVQQHPSATYQYAAQGQYQQPYQQQTSPPNRFQTAVAIPNLGVGAAPVDCPMCGVRALTSLSYHAGNTTHVWAAFAFLLTLVFCFVPYMMSSLKNVQHRCGACGVLLATWHRSGHVEAHSHA